MAAPDLFSVPRRFDLFTILVATTGYAVLFASLRLLDFSSESLGVAGGLFAAVAIGQAVGAQSSPRIASIFAATVFWMLYFIGYAFTLDFGSGRHDLAGRMTIQVIFGAPIWGVITGYFVGVLAAGVFLVSHHLRTKWSFIAERRSESAMHESPWDDAP